LLPVTKEIAERWGRATIEAKRKGLMLAAADGLIAATAGLGVALLNPWNP
jgi:predicted nucleic acid-binding protein